MASEEPHISRAVPSTPGLLTPDTNPATSSSDTSRAAFTQGTTGGLGLPPQAPPGFPARPLVTPGPQAHERLLKPPYATEQTREGELLKGDITPESSVSVIKLMCAEAMKQAAIAAANQLHEGDPVAATLAVNEALKEALAANLFPAYSTPGSDRPKSKIAQEAVLEGITGGRGLSDDDKQKGLLYKRAKLLPAFPGSRCRNEPDLWEEWWEKAYAIKRCTNCDDTFLAYMIKEHASKESELYQTLEHLKHTDGSLDAAGLEGVKALMTEDFAPTGHLMMSRSRERE